MNGTIPQLFGLTFSEAAEVLDNNGFGISAAYTSSGATAGNDGTAASQSPAAGTSQPLGTVVTVTFYQYTPPVSAPTVSISATRTSPTNVSITYSVTAPSDGGNVLWSISGTGSPYTSSQSLSAGTTRTETVNATVTPFEFRYQYTITATNNGGSVSASAFDLGGNPVRTTDSGLPTGTIISVSPTTLYTTLDISFTISANPGAFTGTTVYTVSGPGLSISGSMPQGASETFDFTTSATLSAGTTYTYTVTVTNNVGTRTQTATGTTKAVGPPTNLAVTATSPTSVFVQWSASTTAGATYGVTATGGTVNYTSGTNATITGLTANTSYQVTVVATDSGYSSSATASFTTPVLKTITAAITAVSSNDGTEAVVSWSVTKSDGVTVSILEVYGPDVDAGGSLSGSVTARGLSPGGTYTWYIVAVGSYSGIQISDSKFVTLVMNQAVVGAPSAPQDFTATATNTTTVSLTWNPSTSAGGYPPVTYYISGPGTISTPSTTNNYATVTGLSPGTTYTFSIYAQNTNPSAPNTSATISATTTTLSVSTGIGVLVPNITATSNAEGTAATVTWSTVSYGTSVYYLESDTSGDGLSFYSSALSGSEVVTGLTPGSSYIFKTFVIGYTRSGALVSGFDSYRVVMSNPNPSPAPAPVADKVYYHNGTTWVQASEVQVYNGSWVSSSIKTSDGQGNWT
jgi:hypothetical protein